MDQKSPLLGGASALLVSYQRAAELLDCHPNSLRNYTNPASPWYRPNCPKPVRIGLRSVRFVRQEIDDYIAYLANSARVTTCSA